MKSLQELTYSNTYLCVALSSQPLKKFLDLLFKLKEKSSIFGMSDVQAILQAQHCVWCLSGSEFTAAFEMSINRIPPLDIRMENHKKRGHKMLPAFTRMCDWQERESYLSVIEPTLTDFMHQSIDFVTWDNGNAEKYFCLTSVHFLEFGKNQSR